MTFNSHTGHCNESCRCLPEHKRRLPMIVGEMYRERVNELGMQKGEKEKESEMAPGDFND